MKAKQQPKQQLAEEIVAKAKEEAERELKRAHHLADMYKGIADNWRKKLEELST